MKKLLLSGVVLSTCSLWAQLYVSPTLTDEDTYIYANDVVLYVDGGINLNRNININPDNISQEASIYLRGYAQLMQGNAGINDGNGQISIWQWGWQNNYGYHNWSSPVGNTNPGGASPGNLNFGITSFYDPNWDGEGDRTLEAKRADHIGGNDGQRNHLQIARKWIHILGANGDYASWIHVGANNDIPAGTGFTMKGTYGTSSSNTQLYDFRGRPNNGTITHTITGNGIWRYVGNPYPSHLDLTDFLLENKSVIEGQVYFYDKDPNVGSHILTEIQSGYGIWVPNGGAEIYDDLVYIGTTESTYAGVYTAATYLMYDGSGNPTGYPGTDSTFDYNNKTRFAGIGQGFMVRPNVASGHIEFNNSMRRAIPHDWGEYHNVFRGGATDDNSFQADGDSPVFSDYPVLTQPDNSQAFLRFYVEINDTYLRDMALSLSSETTKAKDWGWDGRHPGLVSKGDSFWVLENETAPFVIQGRPFEINDAVPLGIKGGNEPNTYKVKLADKSNFTGEVFLFDKVNNIYQKIYSINDNSNTISVTHATIYTNSAEEIRDRYYIVYKRDQNSNGPVTFKESDLNFFQNNRAKQLEVYNKQRLAIETISLYEMSGKLVITQNNIGDLEKITLSTSRLSDGIYVVTVITQDNRMIDYKINILNQN